MRIAVLLSGQTRCFLQYKEWFAHQYANFEVDYYLSMREPQQAVIDFLQPVAYEINYDHAPAQPFYNTLQSMLVYHRHNAELEPQYDAIIAHRFDALVGPGSNALDPHVPARFNTILAAQETHPALHQIVDDKILIFDEFAMNSFLWTGMQLFNDPLSAAILGPHWALEKAINGCGAYFTRWERLRAFFFRPAHLQYVDEGDVVGSMQRNWELLMPYIDSTSNVQTDITYKYFR